MSWTSDSGPATLEDMTTTEIETRFPATGLVAELAAVVRGPVLAGGAPAAAAEAAGFQRALRHRPDVVVGATTPEDVRAAVRAAASRRLPVTVQSTGHGLRVPAEGGVLVCTRRMDGVAVDPVARAARVGAGARWGAVVDAAAGHGLMPPSGSFPGVGVVGYTVGGGIALLARADGWAVDQVRAVQLVDGDGGIREVTAASDPARFARLRGTGPLPGEVITALTVSLLEEGTLTGGNLRYDLGPSDTPGDAGPLHAYRAWATELPPEITTGLSVINFPDADGLPPFLRGRRTARVTVAARADAARTETLLAPLRAAAGPAVQDTVAPMRITEGERVHAEPDVPHAYVGDNLLVDDLTPAGLDALAALIGPMTVVNVRQLGGALARPAAVPDTVAGRDAAYLVAALSPVDEAPVDEARVDEARVDEQARLDPEAAARRAAPTRALSAFATAAGGRNPNFRYGPRA